jgi:hypothetical protein
MRWWILILVTAAACDGATDTIADARPDAELHQTAAWTPLLCTSGNPGDPTCPLNIVDLTELHDARLEMVVQPLAMGLYMTNIELTPGPGGLHVENLQLVVWNGGVPMPQLGPFPAVIDLTTDPLLIDSAAVQVSDASARLGLQYGALQ